MSSEDNIFSCSEKAAILYNYYLENGFKMYSSCANGLPNMKDAYNNGNFLKAHKKLKKTINTYKTKNNNEENTCPVCYDKIDDGKVILGCNHTFCLECYNKFHIRNNQCPMCREVFTEKKYQEMPEEYLNSLSNSLNQIKIYKGLHNKKDKYTIEESINELLRNMNYSNMKQTKTNLIEIINHHMFIYGSNVSDFYGKQLYDE